MKVFGQEVGPGSRDLTHFTFGGTQTPTTVTDFGLDTSCESPLLKLPAELRNNIYEHVSREEKVLKLSAGKIVLPSLGGVCKQIRAELRGIFEQEVISNIHLEIQALIVNFNFAPLLGWLDEHDQRPISPAVEKLAQRPAVKVRKLVIHATCRPGLVLAPWLEETSFSPLLQEERLSALLLHNLTTTLNGWSTNEDMFVARYAWCNRVPNSSLKDVAKPYLEFLINDVAELHRIGTENFRRERSGYNYKVAIVADESFRRSGDTAYQFPNRRKPALGFFDTMYKSVRSWGWMRTDIDQKFALMLREACQSGRSELYHGTTLTWHDKSFKKCTSPVFDRAAKDLDGMEIELHAEQQERLRHALVTLEEEMKKKRSKMAAEVEVEEMTAMMAQWHL
jgi:hypothetical protein